MPDGDRYLTRLREDDRSRGFGDALLDQRNVAGFGNIWKSEGCFLDGVDPWRATAAVSDEKALRVVERSRPLMRLSAERGGRIVTVDPGRAGRRRKGPYWVYGREGLPCRRCGTEIRARGQGDEHRTTFWCPSCQR